MDSSHQRPTQVNDDGGSTEKFKNGRQNWQQDHALQWGVHCHFHLDTLSLPPTGRSAEGPWRAKITSRGHKLNFCLQNTLRKSPGQGTEGHAQCLRQTQARQLVQVTATWTAVIHQQANTEGL